MDFIECKTDDPYQEWAEDDISTTQVYEDATRTTESDRKDEANGTARAAFDLTIGDESDE